MVDIAEQVFDAPTRLGFLEEEYFGGLAGEVQSPAWATACGLALSSIRTQVRELNYGGRSPKNKVTEWFENFRERFR
jgi:cell division ATPase FtsA